MDMILTGRAVDAAEAHAIGLANRVVPNGQARAAAEQLAGELAEFPQRCLRSDRLSALHQWGMTEPHAMDVEFGSLARVADEARRGRAGLPVALAGTAPTPERRAPDRTAAGQRAMVLPDPRSSTVGSPAR